MSNTFGLIYFVHDDLQQGLMQQVKDNFFRAPGKKNIKLIFLHNIRKIYKKNKKKKYVSYITRVMEIITTKTGRKKFNLLNKANTWEEGFVMAKEYLQKNGFSENMGLIVLSHAEGFVLKGPEPFLEKLFDNGPIVVYGNDYEEKVFSPDDKYLVQRYGKDYFVSSYTIVDKTPAVSKKRGRQIYERKYQRGKKDFFCKKYEGLFTFQLSSFLKENKFHFKFIAFSSCNAQLYDNGYLFSDVTEFAMGAESYSVVTFWDLPVFINTINAYLDKGAEEMCRQIFKECSKKFRKESDEGYYYLVKMADFNLLHLTFDKIMIKLREAIEGNKPTRSSVLKWISGATVASGDKEVPFFDLVNFFEGQLPNDPFAKEFNEILSKKIVNERSEPPSAGSLQQCGYSLFLPRTKEEFDNNNKGVCNYLEAAKENAFLLNSQYDEFLKELYKI